MEDTLQRARPTLGHLCDDAGAELVDVVLAPRGLDVPVAELVLFDPRDTPAGRIAAGDVVLAVGMAGEDSDQRPDPRRRARRGGRGRVPRRDAAVQPDSGGRPGRERRAAVGRW